MAYHADVRMANHYYQSRGGTIKEEFWFCPSCGQRCSVHVDKKRLLPCGDCGCTFEIKYHYITTEGQKEEG